MPLRPKSDLLRYAGATRAFLEPDLWRPSLGADSCDGLIWLLAANLPGAAYWRLQGAVTPSPEQN